MAPAAVGIGAAASKMRGPRPSCAPRRPPAPGRARSFSISSIGVARLRLESRPAKWNPYPSAPMMPPLTKMGLPLIPSAVPPAWSIAGPVARKRIKSLPGPPLRMPRIWTSNRSIVVPRRTVRPYPAMPGRTWLNGVIAGAPSGEALPTGVPPTRVTARIARAPRSFRTLASPLPARPVPALPSHKKAEGDHPPRNSLRASPHWG